MNIHLCHQGRQLGSFSKEQVEAMLTAGVITDGTLAWTSGLTEWKALREVLQPDTPPPVLPPQAATTITSRFSSGHPNNDPEWNRKKKEFASKALENPETARIVNEIFQKLGFPSLQQTPMTQLAWRKRVCEAEIAVVALEKQQGHNLPVWRENLRLMKLNPPKKFLPLPFMQQVLAVFFPVSQDDLNQFIIKAWKAGKPPQLPLACVSDQTPQDSMPNSCAKPPVLGGGPTNTKVPDVSPKEVEEITQAAKFAYGNQAADDFLDKVMEEAKKSQQRRAARN
jgi:hypothetical protein